MYWLHFYWNSPNGNVPNCLFSHLRSHKVAPGCLFKEWVLPSFFFFARFFLGKKKKKCYWFSKCWIATLNGISLPFESLVRIKRTVELNGSTAKAEQHTVTWPVLCPGSQTNIALWGSLQTHFGIDCIFSLFFKLFFCAWQLLLKERVFQLSPRGREWSIAPVQEQ